MGEYEGALDNYRKFTFSEEAVQEKQCKRAQELFLFVPWTFLYLIFVPDLFQEDKKGSKKVSN